MDAIRVAFRIARNGDPDTLTAVLPDVPERPGFWTCYAHVGQHGSCSRAWYRTTRQATYAEYTDLLDELTNIYGSEPGPVALRVVLRIASKEG
jgi:hypothetical protein